MKATVAEAVAAGLDGESLREASLKVFDSVNRTTFETREVQRAQRRTALSPLFGGNFEEAEAAVVSFIARSPKAALLLPH